MVDNYLAIENFISNNTMDGSSIEESLYICNNFGCRVRIARNEFDTLEGFKILICERMYQEHNVQYYPGNIRLFQLDNSEILEVGDMEGIVNVRMIVVPIICNNHH